MWLFYLKILQCWCSTTYFPKEHIIYNMPASYAASEIVVLVKCCVLFRKLAKPSQLLSKIMLVERLLDFLMHLQLQLLSRYDFRGEKIIKWMNILEGDAAEQAVKGTDSVLSESYMSESISSPY